MRVVAGANTSPAPAAWAPFENQDADILLPKLAWVGLQVVGVAMGVYRLGTMGLLPLASADWTSLLAVKQVRGYTACRQLRAWLAHL